MSDLRIGDGRVSRISRLVSSNIFDCLLRNAIIKACSDDGTTFVIALFTKRNYLPLLSPVRPDGRLTT